MLRFTVILGCFAATAMLAQEETPDKRLRNSADTIREIMATPDKGIPKDLMDRAKCIVIVPGMKKAAFIAGGEYGRGFAACKTAHGHWGPPAAVKLEGGSFGLQLGVDSTDVVMLVMNRRGMERLLSDKFKIGADVQAAAGPVGRNAAADTDALARAEILSWSRARGVFAGVSLDGTVVQHDKAEDKKLYGADVSNERIIKGEVPKPEAGRALTATLNQYAS